MPEQPKYILHFSFMCLKTPSIAIVLLPGTPERSGQGSPEEDLQLPAPLRLDLGLLTPALGLLLGGPHTLPSIQTTVFMQRLSIQNLSEMINLKRIYCDR